MFSRAVACASLLLLSLASVAAADQNEDRAKAAGRGVAFLKSKQAEDGSFASHAGPGITALAAAALLRQGRSADDPAVAKALAYLQGFAREDGAVASKKSLHANYETSLALVAFAEANRDGRYDKLIANAEKFLKGEQWGAGPKADKSDSAYGGAGYGKHERPDLSNTQFLIEALRAAGAGPDDEAMKRALVFVSRCQNLESEHNTLSFPAKNPDGGFYYTAAAGGQSKAGETPDGGLRSYGSMTYAGLKSMIHAGVGADDPRVKAAVKWIGRHYDLSKNPGLGQEGLYYYYHTMAKALDAAGLQRLVDDKGKSHDWRSDLTAELLKRQRPDGSWVNDNARWLEGEPCLVTAYVLLALDYCEPKK